MKKKILWGIFIFVGILILAGVGAGMMYRDRIEEWRIRKELRGNATALEIVDRAEEWRAKNKKANSSDIAALINEAFEWKSLADITQNPKYYRKALEVYKVGIQKFGQQNVPFYWNAGKVAEALQEYTQAEFYYRESIRIAPAYNEPYRYLADLYEYKLKKTDNEVLQVYADGLKATTGDAAIYLEQCSYLRRHNRGEDALQCYQLLVKSFPENQGYKEVVAELQKELKK